MSKETQIHTVRLTREEIAHIVEALIAQGKRGLADKITKQASRAVRK